MKHIHTYSLALMIVIGSLFAIHCATVKAVGPKIIHMAAEDCVEITNGDVKAICATVDELAPLLDLIAARRIEGAKKSVFDGGTD